MSEKVIKVFHVCDEKYNILCKDKLGGTYGKFQFAWGGVVTNKISRTNEEFAIMFCPNGTRAHKLNKETFQHFFSNMKNVEHIYVDGEKIHTLVESLLTLSEEIYDLVLCEVEKKISNRNKTKFRHKPQCPCK